MKPHVPLLALSVLLLSACGPTLTPAPSPAGRGESALTPTPTRTPTPAPTSTPSATPTPSLPSEALTRLEGRDWRIEGDKVVAGDVAWYTLSPEGWRPAQFVADFDSYQFSLEGLEPVATEAGIQLVNPATGEVVYNELGQFDIYFLVEQARPICMPTKMKIIDLKMGQNTYWVAPEDEEYLDEYSSKLIDKFKKIASQRFGFPEILVVSFVPIDVEAGCMGQVAHVTKDTAKHPPLFFFEVRHDGEAGEGEVRVVPVMRNWHVRWSGRKNPYDDDPNW